MPNFSSLARLEVPEKFLWWGGWGGVCKVIFMSNPTVVLRLGWGWGFDNSLTVLVNKGKFYSKVVLTMISTGKKQECPLSQFNPLNPGN